LASQSRKKLQNQKGSSRHFPGKEFVGKGISSPRTNVITGKKNWKIGHQNRLGGEVDGVVQEKRGIEKKKRPQENHAEKESVHPE